jgi:hypothetical protein
MTMMRLAVVGWLVWLVWMLRLLQVVEVLWYFYGTVKKSCDVDLGHGHVALESAFGLLSSIGGCVESIVQCILGERNGVLK